MYHRCYPESLELAQSAPTLISEEVMAIKGLSRSAFEEVMAAYVRPSNAIDSFEHLVGRGKQLERIEEAVASPGKHVFIYGDRGAGKTSLAQTIAYAHNPSASTPVLVACGKKRRSHL